MNATEKKYVEKLKKYIPEILKYKFVIPMDMYDKFESEISALEQQINNLKGDYGHDPSITSFDTKYPMRSESKTAKTAEEILLKHIGKAYNCRSVFHNRYIAAMEEYRQQPGVTDEEIEEWIHNDAHWAKTFINGAIYGAKAMRDGLIPKR